MTKGATVVAMTAAGGLAARRLMAGRGANRWSMGMPPKPKDRRMFVVTVNRALDEIARDGHLPEPLARLGDAIEVEMRPAPGGRGTELIVRMHGDAPTGAEQIRARFAGEDPRQAVRMALRQAKQILETGEVLNPDRPGTNKQTMTGVPLDFAIRRAQQEGRL